MESAGAFFLCVLGVVLWVVVVLIGWEVIKWLLSLIGGPGGPTPSAVPAARIDYLVRVLAIILAIAGFVACVSWAFTSCPYPGHTDS
jgi:hypothetical protein